MFRALRWLALALFITGPALAQPSTEADIAAARAHFSAGIRLYDKGDYEGALVEFRAAHASHARPQILVNIGLCLRALGRNAEAIETLETLVADPSADDPLQTATKRTLDELRAKVASIRIRVVLNVSPGIRAPDPTVSLDQTPLPPRKALNAIWVDPGTHTISARAVGFTEVWSNVTVKAGERDVPVDLSLVGMISTPEPSLDVKVDPTPKPPARPPLTISSETKWYLGASIGFCGGELPVRVGGAQGLIGALFVARFGRRFGNYFSVEIDGEAMGAGTREFSFDASTMSKRSFAVSHIALGVGPRIVTSTKSPRFTAAGIGGVVNQKIVYTDHPSEIAGNIHGSPTGYLQIEAGMQIDAGTVTLEGVAFIGMLGLSSPDLASEHTVMTRYGAKVALQFSF
jgi:hypothetical protein